MWPPGLEGPDRCIDTMDVDGSLGPAWTTPLSLLPTSSTTASPQGTGDTAWGTLPHRRCKCVMPILDILRDGLRVTALSGLT